MQKTGKVERITYNLKEASSALGISEATVRRLANRGEIDSMKLAGRRCVSAKSLFSYVEKQRLATINSL